jgi:hypothetical protein
MALFWQLPFVAVLSATVTLLGWGAIQVARDAWEDRDLDE